MRILLIHSDHLKYQTKSKTRIAEEIDEEKKKGQFENALVVFTAVEKEDEKNPTAVVDNAVKEIMDVAEKVKAENVVIYPYAHLSSSLGAPKIAKEILANMESALLSQNLPASRVPFGWYKAFEVSCKGHPLSELSRSISSEVPEDVKEESDEEESQFFILNEGELLDIEDYTYQSEDLKKLVDYELGRGESTGEEPPHVKLMREKNLADYEPSADVGHLRWYPKGRLIRDLLSDYVYTLVTDRGAMPVETPIMYDLADEAIRVHAEKFGERQYRMTSGKKDLMLRFAACFGAFRILADSFLTWKNLPVGIYELSTYSFRLEKKGEVVGLKRLRGFTMPDLHTVCSDVEQSLQEFDSQIEMCKGTGEALDVNYEVIFRATADFIEENREWINQAAARIGKPVLMEILPKRKHYWICKMDFAALDALGRPIENPTIQIDVESGKRFGITYIDSEEKEHHPYILHCSPTGSIERVICSLLEKSAMKMNDTVPMFPLWLSPTQVRVIPIAERHNEYAHKVAQEIKNARIRVDVDDRPETVGKKIRNAGKEWVPYVIVIGDREMESGSELTVNVRETGQKVSMGLQELIEVIQMETKGMPFRPLPLLMDLSRRVNF
ncbi:MAG: threonyl-tRNA synthetase [Methanobacterium sp.]|jgi:threonyl-tRNA synthetase|uniref:threonine--tRNA ligase n=1 Tax=Methanobacterium sp. TaxID=2164 RepID=UPI0003C9C247|nr:threonine--tRNA ligase [Methanobacterium sp.]MDI3548917.1 threonyl-tRNA synthetase [Methanobacterium sp.]CDG66137.1 Threonine-tRNA ligase [Methanobacterium sp. MB1]